MTRIMPKRCARGLAERRRRPEILTPCLRRYRTGLRGTAIRCRRPATIRSGPYLPGADDALISLDVIALHLSRLLL